VDIVVTDHNDNTDEEHGCYGPRNRKLQTKTIKIDRIQMSKAELKKNLKKLSETCFGLQRANSKPNFHNRRAFNSANFQSQWMYRGDIIAIESLPLDAASQQQLLTHKFSLWTPPQVLLFWYETCALKSTVTLGERQLQTLFRSQVALSTRSDQKTHTHQTRQKRKTAKLQIILRHRGDTEKTKEIGTKL